MRKGRLTPTLCNGEARDNAVGPLYTGCLYSYHVLRVIPTLIPDSEYSQNEAPGFWAPFQLSASSCGQTRCIKPRLFSPSNGELLTTISPVQVERSKFRRPKLTILEGSSFFLPPRSSLSAKTRILEGHQSWANHRYRVHRGCTGKREAGPFRESCPPRSLRSFLFLGRENTFPYICKCKRSARIVDGGEEKGLNELARRWNIQIPVNGFRDKVSPRSPFTPWRNLIRRRRTVPLFRDPRSRKGAEGEDQRGRLAFGETVQENRINNGQTREESLAHDP